MKRFDPKPVLNTERFEACFKAIDAHTEGEFCRVVYAGFPEGKGDTILDKVIYCHNFNEVANTNIQRVFELILRTAVKNKVPQSEMPSILYIISDMEFDYCTKGAELTNFEYAKQIFADAGYQLPRVVFWNVQSRNAQQPVTQNEQGVALVSGCSPRIFSMLRSGILSPLGYMLDILGAERYAKIAA